MAYYRPKYYALKASITEENITNKDSLKIWMYNSLGSVFKTYIIIINDSVREDAKLKDNKKILKAVKEKKTRMKADEKVFVNFADLKSHAFPQRARPKKKKYV